MLCIERRRSFISETTVPERLETIMALCTVYAQHNIQSRSLNMSERLDALPP